MPRLLYVSQATVGGVAKWIIDVIQRLPSDFIVDVAIPSEEGTLHRDLRRMGIEVHPLPMVHGIQPLVDYECARKLYSILKYGNYEILHGHSAKGGYLARITGRYVGIPVIYSPHAWSFMSAIGLKRRFYILLEKVAGCWTDRLIAVSEEEGAVGIRMGLIAPERVRCIPNGVELPEYEGVTPISRESLGLTEEDMLIGCVARLAPQKGIPYLLDAFARVVKQVPWAHLALLGDGPMRCQLEHQTLNLGISERVSFLGWQPDPRPYMATFDIFVLPSLWEGLPLSLLEAMALRLPIVATRVTGTTEVLSEGVGMLVPPADATALADALVLYAEHPEMRLRDGQLAYYRIKKIYNLERTINQLVEVYRELLDNTAISNQWSR